MKFVIFLLLLCFNCFRTLENEKDFLSFSPFLDPETLIQRIKAFLGQKLHVFPKTSTSDPDIYRTEAELFFSRELKLDIHKAITPDDYILTLWRVGSLNPPQTKPKYPILLQHGLLDSSFSWILNQKNQSLGYILASLGYDVWFGNSRGNRYSNEHKYYTTSDDAFWEFSFDEMAKYDLPTNVEYIKNTTGCEKVIYIAHSQGTTQLYALLSENPAFKENLRGVFGLGPVIKNDHQGSPVINIMRYTSIISFLNFLGMKSMLYVSSDILPSLGLVCEKVSGLCVDIVRFICGDSDVVHYNEERMSVMASHEPGGTSTQNLLHWIQMVKSGQFSKFDYGKTGNLNKYGTESPPLYNVNNLMQFDVESHLYIGDKDYLANLVDYQFLLMHLPPKSTFSQVIKDYAHLDYVWGTDAYELVYKDIIKVLQTME